MRDDKLRERIARLVLLVLGEQRVAEEWDSLQQIEVVLAVEDEYGVTIPESDIPNLRTVDDLATYLEGVRAAR
ncbi:MAG: acyl carrier protein [Candidatus Dormibacteraeota bacterium]|nr:acyl carrier protein [Candidatus Dormibacteraeota bacterium]